MDSIYSLWSWSARAVSSITRGAGPDPAYPPPPPVAESSQARPLTVEGLEVPPSAFAILPSAEPSAGLAAARTPESTGADSPSQPSANQNHAPTDQGEMISSAVLASPSPKSTTSDDAAPQLQEQSQPQPQPQQHQLQPQSPREPRFKNTFGGAVLAKPTATDDSQAAFTTLDSPGDTPLGTSPPNAARSALTSAASATTSSNVSQYQQQQPLMHASSVGVDVTNAPGSSSTTMLIRSTFASVPSATPGTVESGLVTATVPPNIPGASASKSSKAPSVRSFASTERLQTSCASGSHQTPTVIPEYQQSGETLPQSNHNYSEDCLEPNKTLPDSTPLRAETSFRPPPLLHSNSLGSQSFTSSMSLSILPVSAPSAPHQGHPNDDESSCPQSQYHPGVRNQHSNALSVSVTSQVLSERGTRSPQPPLPVTLPQPQTTQVSDPPQRFYSSQTSQGQQIENASVRRDREPTGTLTSSASFTVPPQRSYDYVNQAQGILYYRQASVHPGYPYFQEATPGVLYSQQPSGLMPGVHEQPGTKSTMPTVAQPNLNSVAPPLYAQYHMPFFMNPELYVTGQFMYPHQPYPPQQMMNPRADHQAAYAAAHHTMPPWHPSAGGAHRPSHSIVTNSSYGQDFQAEMEGESEYEDEDIEYVYEEEDEVEVPEEQNADTQESSVVNNASVSATESCGTKAEDAKEEVPEDEPQTRSGPKNQRDATEAMSNDNPSLPKEPRSTPHDESQLSPPTTDRNQAEVKYRIPRHSLATIALDQLSENLKEEANRQGILREALARLTEADEVERVFWIEQGRLLQILLERVRRGRATCAALEQSFRTLANVVGGLLVTLGGEGSPSSVSNTLASPTSPQGASSPSTYSDPAKGGTTLTAAQLTISANGLQPTVPGQSVNLTSLGETGSLGHATLALDILRKSALRLLTELRDRGCADALAQTAALTVASERSLARLEAEGKRLAALVKSHRMRVNQAWKRYCGVAQERDRVVDVVHSCASTASFASAAAHAKAMSQAHGSDAHATEPSQGSPEKGSVRSSASAPRPASSLASSFYHEVRDRLRIMMKSAFEAFGKGKALEQSTPKAASEGLEIEREDTSSKAVPSTRSDDGDGSNSAVWQEQRANLRIRQLLNHVFRRIRRRQPVIINRLRWIADHARAFSNRALARLPVPTEGDVGAIDEQILTVLGLPSELASSTPETSKTLLNEASVADLEPLEPSTESELLAAMAYEVNKPSRYVEDDPYLSFRKYDRELYQLLIDQRQYSIRMSKLLITTAEFEWRRVDALKRILQQTLLLHHSLLGQARLFVEGALRVVDAVNADRDISAFLTDNGLIVSREPDPAEVAERARLRETQLKALGISECSEQGLDQNAQSSLHSLLPCTSRLAWFVDPLPGLASTGANGQSSETPAQSRANQIAELIMRGDFRNPTSDANLSTTAAVAAAAAAAAAIATTSTAVPSHASTGQAVDSPFSACPEPIDPNDPLCLRLAKSSQVFVPPTRAQRDHTTLLSVYRQELEREGWVERLGTSLLFRSTWSPIYCALSRTGYFYLLSSPDAKSPLETVALHFARVRLAPLTHAFAFEILTPNESFFAISSEPKSILLKAPSEDLFIAWLSALRKYAKDEDEEEEDEKSVASHLDERDPTSIRVRGRTYHTNSKNASANGVRESTQGVRGAHSVREHDLGEDWIEQRGNPEEELDDVDDDGSFAL